MLGPEKNVSSLVSFNTVLSCLRNNCKKDDHYTDFTDHGFFTERNPRNNCIVKYDWKQDQDEQEFIRRHTIQ